MASEVYVICIFPSEFQALQVFHLKMGLLSYVVQTFSLLPEVRPSIVFQDSKTGVASAETFQTNSPLCRGNGGECPSPAPALGKT